MTLVTPELATPKALQTEPLRYFRPFVNMTSCAGGLPFVVLDDPLQPLNGYHENTGFLMGCDFVLV